MTIDRANAAFMIARVMSKLDQWTPKMDEFKIWLLSNLENPLVAVGRAASSPLEIVFRSRPARTGRPKASGTGQCRRKGSSNAAQC